jgi:hypothetical protein
MIDPKRASCTVRTYSSLQRVMFEQLTYEVSQVNRVALGSDAQRPARSDPLQRRILFSFERGAVGTPTLSPSAFQVEL